MAEPVNVIGPDLLVSKWISGDCPRRRKLGALMESLSPQEILKLLEAEADSLQQMQSKVEKQLERLKLEEQLILRSASWTQDQQIAGDEDLAPLPRPLSPLHEAHKETTSESDERQAGGGGTAFESERIVTQEPSDSESEWEKELNAAVEAGGYEDSEDDEEP